MDCIKDCIDGWMADMDGIPLILFDSIPEADGCQGEVGDTGHEEELKAICFKIGGKTLCKQREKDGSPIFPLLKSGLSPILQELKVRWILCHL